MMMMIQIQIALFHAWVQVEHFPPHMQGHLCHRCHHRRVWRRGNFLLQGVRLQRQTCHCLKQRKKSNQVTLIHIQMCSGQIPDHPAEQDTLAPNPNIRCSGWQFVQLEVSPPLSIHSHSNISVVLIFSCIQKLRLAVCSA